MVNFPSYIAVWKNTPKIETLAGILFLYGLKVSDEQTRGQNSLAWAKWYTIPFKFLIWKERCEPTNERYNILGKKGTRIVDFGEKPAKIPENSIIFAINIKYRWRELTRLIDNFKNATKTTVVSNQYQWENLLNLVTSADLLRQKKIGGSGKFQSANWNFIKRSNQILH